MKRLYTYNNKYKRGRKGFTMVEVIAVLVIIAIVAAFATPGIVTYMKNMRQVRQDDTVRLLYSAAQNRLTYLSSHNPDGEYTEFCKLFVPKDTVEGSEYEGSGTGGTETCVGMNVLRDVTGAPVALMENGEIVYKVTTTSDGSAIGAAGVSAGASAGAQKVTEKIYIYHIDINDPVYGEAAQQAMEKLLGESGMLNAIEPGKVEIDVDLSLRFILQVRYQNSYMTAPSIYNEANVQIPDSAKVETDQLKMSVNAENGEELIVHVTCSSLAEEYKSQLEEENLKNFHLVMTLTSDSVKDGVDYDLDDEYWFHAELKDGIFSADITLDSLRSGFHFAELFESAGFVPGENIAATFQLFYDGELESTGTDPKPVIISPSALSSVTVNSLFADVKGNGEGKTAYLANGRHLQNLTNCADVLPDGDPNQITAALQYGDIDWDKTQGYEKYADELKFVPIENTEIKSFKGETRTISNLEIKGAADTGMFSDSVAAFSDVCLVNPSAEGVKDTGILAGNLLDGGSITNCRAYITDTNAEHIKNYTVTSSGGNAGGLVGAVTGEATIDHSFAALYQVGKTGTTHAGGLIGSIIGDAEITSCYADTKYVIGTHAGGFVGSMGTDADVSHSYAVTEVLRASDTAAGFAADNAGEISDAYALVSSVETKTSTGDKYGFASGGTVTDDCYYYIVKDFGADKGESSIAKLAEKVLGNGWVLDVNAETGVSTNKYSHPYQTTGDYSYLMDAAYPAPRIKGDTEKNLPDLDHYGNWPEAAAKYTICFVSQIPDGIASNPEWKDLPVIEDYEYDTKVCDTETGLPEVPLKDGELTYQSADGRTFKYLEWNTKADGSGDTITATEAKPFQLSEEQVLALADEDTQTVYIYAIWLSKYKVFYHNNCTETLAEDKTPEDTKAYDKDDPADIPESPAVGDATYRFVKDGVTYLFAGWSESDTATAADDKYAPGKTFQIGMSDVNLFAVWEPAYQVKYALGTAENATTKPTAPTDSSVYALGDIVEISENFHTRTTATASAPHTSFMDKTTGIIYYFKEWQDKSGKTYAPGADLTVADELADDHTITLTAVWEPAYHVEYKIGDDALAADLTAPTDSSDYLLNDKATVSSSFVQRIEGTPDPDATGYTDADGVPYLFIGWKAEDASTHDAGSEFAIYKQLAGSDQVVTLTAQWEKAYRVTYDANKGTGSHEDANLYLSGETVTVADGSDFSREGFTFEGWNINKDAKPGDEDGWYDDTFTIAADTTLYAIWKLVPYKVIVHVRTDDLPDESFGEPLYLQAADGTRTPLTHDKGGDYTASVGLEEGKTSKKFDIVYGAAYTQSGVRVTVEKTKKTAEATVDFYTLTVTVNLDGSEWTDSAAPTVTIQNHNKSTETVESGSKLAKGSVWDVHLSDDAAGETYRSEVTMDKKQEIVADYYTLTYDTKNYYDEMPDGEDTGVTLKPDGTASVQYLRTGSAVHVAELSGYSYTAFDAWNWGYVGWNTKQDGSGTTYAPEGVKLLTPAESTFTITKTTTLYAQWDKRLYQIQYNAHATECKTQEAFEADPEKLTKRFCDTIDNANNYLGGESVTVLPNLLEDERTQLFDRDPSQTDIDKKAYYFIGWTTEPGGGTLYQPGDTFVVGEPGEDSDTNKIVKLYAYWGYKGTYTVVFHPNGAVESGKQVNTVFNEKATTVTLSPNTYVRQNYIMQGWATAPDAKSARFADKQTFAAAGATDQLGGAATVNVLKGLDTDENGDTDNVIHLYAIWQEGRDYSVTFQLDHMSAKNASTIAYRDQAYVATLSYEGGYNPPKSASDITIYVDNDKDGQFGAGEQLIAMKDYDYDPYTLKLTIPADQVKGNIKIVAGAISGKHTLEFYQNTSTEKLLKTEQYEYGYYTILPSITELGGSNGNQVFTGWNTKADGSGEQYQAGDPFEVTHNFKLYAQWKDSKVVGAFIYNTYRYNTTEYDEKEKNVSQEYHYILAKGETQLLATGQTFEDIDNGGFPYCEKSVTSSTDWKGKITYTYGQLPYSFYYGIMLPYDSSIQQTAAAYLNKYEISYTATTGDGTLNSTSLKTGWHIPTKPAMTDKTFKLDERYNTLNSEASFQNDGTYAYFYFKRENEHDKTKSPDFSVNACVPEITSITIKNTDTNEQCTFEFQNSARPSKAKSGGNTTGELDTSPFAGGIAGIEPKVSVSNGNVPTLSREYAYYYQDEGCQASFSVDVDVNDTSRFKLSSIRLTDEDGRTIVTENNLYTQAGSKYTFNPAAMDELEPGTYRVTFDYLDGDTDYDADPFFDLYVYPEGVKGYRYILLEINELPKNAKGQTEGNTQFSEISLCSDPAGNHPYHYEESAVLYDFSNQGSHDNEDAGLCIDNNTRTKYCSPFNKNNGSDTSDQKKYLLIDVGEGYQLSTNTYGYFGYFTVGDTEVEEYWTRSPNGFAYYGSNNEDCLNGTVGNINTNTSGWTKLIDGKVTSEEGIAAYKKDENFVKPNPDHNTYTLTYDGLGSTVTGYGDQVITYELPTATGDNAGKYFLGWSEKRNAKTATYAPGSHYDLRYDVTLYAVWSTEAPDWAVVYYPNLPTGKTEKNLTQFPNNYYGSGSASVSTVIPVLEGYRFKEWHLLRDIDNDRTTGDGKVNPENNTGLEYVATYAPGATISPFSQNYTLYVQWETAKRVKIADGNYTVKVTGGQVGDAVHVDGYTYYYLDSSNKLTFTVTPDAGYRVTGVEAIDGTVSGTYAVTANTDTAEVTINTEKKKYNVTITDSNVTWALLEGYSASNVEYGEPVAFKAKADDGYSILLVTAAWTDDAGNSYSQILSEVSTEEDGTVYLLPSVQGNTMVTVKTVTGTVTPITVTYAANAPEGSTATGSMDDQTLKVMATDETTLYPLPVCGYQVEGYQFAGWSYGDTASSALSGKEISDMATDGKLTLNAVWKKLYTVTLNANGGTLSGGLEQRIAEGESCTLPTPTKEQYRFDGWFDETDNLVGMGGDSFTVNADRTLKAKWTQLFTVTFDAGSGGKFNSNNQQKLTYSDVADGTELTLPTEEPTRTGYIFDGWTDERGNIVTGPITVDADRTLNAKWARCYTLTLKNGTANNSPTIWSSSKLTKAPKSGLGVDESGRAYSRPSKNGWTLDGWYTKDNNNKPGEKRLNADGTPTTTGDWTLTENVTLYALWTKTGATPANGGYYIIVSATPSAGNKVNALNTSAGNTEYTYGSTAISGSLVWYYNNKLFRVNSTGNYLRHSNNSLGVSGTNSSNTWTVGADSCRYTSGNGKSSKTYSLTYNNGWKIVQDNSSKCYFIQVSFDPN